MQKAKLLVILFALVEGGWFAFDGLHGFVTGDYVTPDSGELGPWSQLVEAIGVDPRSNGMMGFHVFLGFGSLLALFAFVRNLSWSWKAMLCCAVAGIWYLPFGTLLSLLQILFLLTVLRPR